MEQGPHQPYTDTPDPNPHIDSLPVPASYHETPIPTTPVDHHKQPLFHNTTHSPDYTNTPIPNTQPLTNPFRIISFVATKKDPPYVPARDAPRPDTSSFKFAMFTSLSIAPDATGPPQVEAAAAARTLHSMGYNPPSSTSAAAPHQQIIDPSAAATLTPLPSSAPISSHPAVLQPQPDDITPRVTHVNAVGGNDTITVSAAAQQPASAAFNVSAPQSPPAMSMHMPTSANPASATVGMRQPAMAAYPTSIDPMYRDAALRHAVPVQRSSLNDPAADFRAYPDQSYLDPRVHGQHIPLDQMRRLQEYQSHAHVTPEAHHRVQQQLHPPHLVKDQQRQQVAPHQQLPPAHAQQQYAHAQQQHAYDRQLHVPPQGSLPEATAMSRQARHANSNVALFRADGSSVPATPTTPATSATQPFPATPSSPDNNGASSNGSAPREHSCTYPGCTKRFDRRYNLTVHYRRHTDEMPYPCKFPGCTQKFKWRSSQSHHMKTRHRGAVLAKNTRNSNVRAQVSNANRAHVVNATGSVNAASVNVANAASAINGTSGNGNPNGINGMNGMNGMNGVSGISDVNGASRALRYPPISSGVDVVESSGATRDTGVLELDGADDKGGYKRTFSPRKRQRGQRRGQ